MHDQSKPTSHQRGTGGPGVIQVPSVDSVEVEAAESAARVRRLPPTRGRQVDPAEERVARVPRRQTVRREERIGIGWERSIKPHKSWANSLSDNVDVHLHLGSCRAAPSHSDSFSLCSCALIRLWARLESSKDCGFMGHEQIIVYLHFIQ